MKSINACGLLMFCSTLMIQNVLVAQRAYESEALRASLVSLSNLSLNAIISGEIRSEFQHSDTARIEEGNLVKVPLQDVVISTTETLCGNGSGHIMTTTCHTVNTKKETLYSQSIVYDSENAIAIKLLDDGANSVVQKCEIEDIEKVIIGHRLSEMLSNPPIPGMEVGLIQYVDDISTSPHVKCLGSVEEGKKLISIEPRNPKGKYPVLTFQLDGKSRLTRIQQFLKHSGEEKVIRVSDVKYEYSDYENCPERMSIRQFDVDDVLNTTTVNIKSYRSIGNCVVPSPKQFLKDNNVKQLYNVSSGKFELFDDPM